MPDTLTVNPGQPGPAPTLTLENASQARGLDDLQNIAAQLEGGAAAAGPGGGASAPIADQVQRETNALRIGSALIAGREGFCIFTGLQSPRVTMSDAKCSEVATLWGAWCDKRGVDLGVYLGNHADTIGAALATIVVGASVYQAARLELASRPKPEKKETVEAAPPEVPVPPVATGSNVAIFPGQPS